MRQQRVQMTSIGRRGTESIRSSSHSSSEGRMDRLRADAGHRVRCDAVKMSHEPVGREEVLGALEHTLARRGRTDRVSPRVRLRLRHGRVAVPVSTARLTRATPRATPQPAVFGVAPSRDRAPAHALGGQARGVGDGASLEALDGQGGGAARGWGDRLRRAPMHVRLSGAVRSHARSGRQALARGAWNFRRRCVGEARFGDAAALAARPRSRRRGGP